MSERCKHGKHSDNPCWECDEERGSSLPQALDSSFRDLTVQGLATLKQRLDDAVGSAITTASTAHHAGNEDVAGKLSLINTTLSAISERVNAMREKMANRLDQTHWACACVKRDRAGRLKAIKLNPNSVQRCPVCGEKQCTLLKAPNTEVSSGAKTILPPKNTDWRLGNPCKSRMAGPGLDPHKSSAPGMADPRNGAL